MQSLSSERGLSSKKSKSPTLLEMNNNRAVINAHLPLSLHDIYLVFRRGQPFFFEESNAHIEGYDIKVVPCDHALLYKCSTIFQEEHCIHWRKTFLQLLFVKRCCALERILWQNSMKLKNWNIRGCWPQMNNWKTEWNTLANGFSHPVHTLVKKKKTES